MRMTLLASFVLIAASTTAFADRIKTACYIDPQGQIQGTNPDTLTEVASVSKMLTTHWVISKLGPHAQLETRIHINPVSEGLFDVHIQGGLDPSFNVNRLAVVAGQLNFLGVKHIRNMTFDQNFRYLVAVYSGPQVDSNPANFVLTKDKIVPLLRASIQNIKKSYANVRAGVDSKVSNDDMPATVSLAVDDISFKDAAEFSRTPETKTYISRSVEIYEIIKQMNLKSNNYIANILFEHMGGAEAYRAFIKENKSYGPEQVNFLNGSGYPMRTSINDGESCTGLKEDKGTVCRVDNKTTCRSIVTIVKDLRDLMKAQNMSLANVVAVSGAEPKGSTVDGYYKTDLMEGALVAKTGTSDPAVALAGLASTKQGNIYFAVVVSDGRKGSPGASGRMIIRQQVESIFKKYGGSDEISYSAESFFEVDNGGKLQLQQQAQALQ